MKNIGFAILTLMNTGMASATLPGDYLSRSAEDKVEVLLQNLRRDIYRDDELPTRNPGGLDLAKLLFTSFLQVTFKHQSDEMPVNRKKLIHTYGSVAKVSFDISGQTPFTGVFASGGIGVARISLAKQGGSLTPGMGLKILVDGQPSINFQVMPSLDGQGDNHNVFDRRMSNIVAPPTSPVLGVLGSAFAKAVRLLPQGPENERTLPLIESASVTSSGQIIARPITPREIIFIPTPESRAFNSSTNPADMRTVLARMPVGMVLYSVWAKAANNAPAVQLGTLKLESPFVASEYGDETLFFQHQSQRRR